MSDPAPPAPPSLADRPDDPAASIASLRARLGLPDALFRGVLAAAVEHAQQSPPLPGAPPWIEIGPRNVGGRIRDLVEDPNTPGTLYAGSAFGGVWRTRDRGESWEVLGSPADAVPVGALAITPDSRRLYVGTGEPVLGYPPGRGLFEVALAADPAACIWTRRVDAPDAGGTQPQAGAADRYARIRVDPNDPNRFWAASTTGLWRWEGGGFVQDVEGDANDVTDVALSPTADGAGLSVHVAIRGQGVYRFTWTGGQKTGWTHQRSLPGRTRLAVCRSAPDLVYAVGEDGDGFATAVHRSIDRGGHWDAGETLPKMHGADATGQADYSLALEVHPSHPNVVFAGEVDLFRSYNSGVTWARVIDWQDYLTDPGRHPDQHAIVFERARSHAVFVGNDGGVTLSENLGRTWRKRSYGILAAQFNDVTVHPRFPFLTSGGLQDNGTFLGYGGATWYQVDGGDGGMVGFDPLDVRRIYATSQDGLDGLTLGAIGTEGILPLPDLGPQGALRESSEELSDGIATAQKATFVGIVEHHPARSNHLLLGRAGAGFVGTVPAGGGTLSFSRLKATFQPDDPEQVEVSTVAYAPDDPDHRWWLGTSKGEVFRTVDADATPWTRVDLPGAGTPWVTRIAVHPADHLRVAVATGYEPASDLAPAGTPGKVYLSFTEGIGASWIDVSGRAPGTLASAHQELPPSPITCLAFDPGADRLYAGTLAGVYALDYAGIAPGTPPIWQSLLDRLPLVLVTDLAFAPGTRRLRCATFGRGMFEVDLGGPPRLPTRIYLRQHATEEGLVSPRDLTWGDPARLDGDPRAVAGSVPLDLAEDSAAAYQAFDLRLDAPPLLDRPGRLDGAEFDNELVSEAARPGVVNLVYVQAHNSGAAGGPAAAVTLHLYKAKRGAAAPFLPPLPAAFWTGFPLAAGASFPAMPAGDWSEVDGVQTLSARPGEHAVATFRWTPGVDDLGEVILLALAHSDADPLPAGPVGIRDLLTAERRAVARVVAVSPELLIRDGVDDDGEVGSIAWGGRSPDIVVTQLPADPAVAFADLGDPQPGEPLRAGPNRIFVRVHNRSAVPVDARVDLYFAPTDAPWTWPDPAQRIAQAVAVAGIPAGGWKFTAEIDWTPPTAKPHLLVAIVRHPFDLPPDPLPSPAHSDVESFWLWFLDGLPAGNVAFRAFRFAV